MHGTMASVAVLIAVVKLMSLVLNSSSVSISVGIRSSLSSGVFMEVAPINLSPIELW